MNASLAVADDTRLVDPGVFTAEVGFGTGVLFGGGEPEVDGALQGAYTVGLGGWTSSRLCLSAHLEGSTASVQRGLDLDVVHVTALVPRIQFWPTPRWTFAVGYGRATLDADGRSDRHFNVYRADVSYVFARSDHHAHHLRASWWQGDHAERESLSIFVLGWVWQRL